MNFENMLSEKNVKKPETKDNVLHESICIKYSKEVNLHKKEVQK
jgi:hypothetical protein